MEKKLIIPLLLIIFSMIIGCESNMKSGAIIETAKRETQYLSFYTASPVSSGKDFGFYDSIGKFRIGDTVYITTKPQ